MANTKSFGYIPGLDGIRALAVLAVIAYHLNLPFAQGGFLGVTVFFVLSGFLITSLLIWEWEHTATINLKQFWIRRAKRLLPAMILLLIILNVFIPFFRLELVANLRQDSIAAFFYYSNWYYIFQDIPYFEAFGITSLLTHFWSLAIEEQFYIFWAPLTLLLLKWIRNRKAIFTLLLFGAALSATAMTLIYEPDLDPSRVYYGTDTRLFSLLIGASFAIPLKKISIKLNRWSLEILGLIGILTFIVMTIFINQYDHFIYQGGMAILSIATAGLVLSMKVPSNLFIRRFLELQPLKWIGLRSYGIYLWHYPVILLTTPNVNVDGIDYFLVLFQITLSLLLAAISYTIIEKPIRRGQFRFTVKNSTMIAISIGFLFGLSNQNYINETAHSQMIMDHSEINLEPIPLNEKDIGIKQVPKLDFTLTQPNQKPPVEEKVHSPTSSKNQNTPPVKKEMTTKITAIGDSVLIIPGPLLKKKFANITVDAKVSRQMHAAKDIVRQLKAKNQLGEIVVIELGTNGPFPEKTITDLMNTIGKERKVLFINVRVPRQWESIVNKRLIEAKKKHGNMIIVDWYATSANHPDYFAKDGVHLQPKGAQVYANMIEKAIQKAAAASK
ncbi:acyltransferase family protein [Pseudoneobacillus sp. C159]